MKTPAALALLLVLLIGPAEVGAQTTRLRVSGFAGNIGNSAPVNHDNGYRDSGSSTLVRVDIQNPPDGLRHTEVFIRADNATLGGSKPVGDLQWRLDEVPEGWVPLTTSNVSIYSEFLEFDNDIWSKSLWFRMYFDWEDPPLLYGTTVTFTLVVSAP